MNICGMLFSDTAFDKLEMLSEHIDNCTSCQYVASVIRKVSARKAGLVRTENKSKASINNGKLGGRPCK